FSGWPNYLSLGLGVEQIPELIRMATDPELNTAMSDTLEVWAPIHAMRALSQLHAEAAIEPLIPLLDQTDDDDSLFDELPAVFAAIGPAAIPALSNYLNDLSHASFARVTAANDALTKIANAHPETRQIVVEQLTKELSRAGRNDPGANGFIIAALIDFHA